MSNRKLLAALTGFALCAGTSAYAADMPVKAPPAPIAPAPIMTWTGFYIGVNLGGAWADAENSNTGAFSDNVAGVVGGGQLGYNWQVGNFLLGIEGDFNGSSQSKSTDGTILGVPFSSEVRLPWFATIRGRLGYVNGPWLVYVTGGGAWVNLEADLTIPAGSFSDSTTRSAWTVGGGVEWMFLPKWSAKLEYLFIQTDDNTFNFAGTTVDAKIQENVVRAGLNYHF